MAQKTLVVEITQAVTRVIEMDFATKRPVIYNFFTFATPDDTVRDGLIHVNEDFVSEFRSHCSIHGTSAKHVIFLLTSGRIISRDVVIPLVQTSQIQTVVDGMMTDYFPVDPNLYHIVYKILAIRKEDKEIDLTLLAIPNDITAGYFELTKALSLQLINISFVGNSSLILQNILDGISVYESPLLQMLSKSSVEASRARRMQVKQDKKKSVEADSELEPEKTQSDGAIIQGSDLSDSAQPVKAVVKIEYFSTFLTIMRGGNIVVQRSLQEGINELLEDAIAYGDFDQNITKEEVLNLLSEKLLIKTSLVGSISPTDKNAVLKTKLTEAANELIEAISQNIDYYLTRNEGDYVEKVTLVGAGAGILGFARLFQNEVGYEVESVSHIPGISFKLKKKEADYSRINNLSQKKEKAEKEGTVDDADKTMSIDDLEKAFNERLFGDEEPEEDEDIGGAELHSNTFLPFTFALLIASGLSREGIVTEAERFGDSSMAKIRKDKRTAGYCILGGVVLLLGAATLALLSYIDLKNARDTRDKLNKDIASYEAAGVEEDYHKYLAEKEKTNKLRDIFAYTHSPNENLVAFIEELEEKIPSETLVLSLIANKDGITMDLQSPDKQSAAKVIMTLKGFESVDVVSSAGLTDTDSFNNRDAVSRIVSYTVSLLYKNVPFDVDAALAPILAENAEASGDNTGDNTGDNAGENSAENANENAADNAGGDVK